VGLSVSLRCTGFGIDRISAVAASISSAAVP
jgi:hypothetical protein